MASSESYRSEFWYCPACWTITTWYAIVGGNACPRCDEKDAVYWRFYGGREEYRRERSKVAIVRPLPGGLDMDVLETANRIGGKEAVKEIILEQEEKLRLRWVGGPEPW